jgi:hypothetical protein
VDALIIAGCAWLAAAMFLYADSPAFLTHPHSHFVALRLATGLIVLPAIGLASVFLITGRTELSCAVGIPAGCLLWLSAVWLQRFLDADQSLTAEERLARDKEVPPFATTAARWFGGTLSLAGLTFALVILARG